MLAGNYNIHKSLDEFEIQSDLIGDPELAALEHLKMDVAPFSRFTVVAIPGK